MYHYVDDIIVTLKLKMCNYNKQSEAYKEMLYTIEMLECAKRLDKENRNKAALRRKKLGISKHLHQ